METKAKVRLDYLDIAKGIGIILVVWQHCVGNGPDNATPALTLMITSFFMPLFFILSGYLYKLKPTKNYLYSKAKSLLVPLIIIYLYNFYMEIVTGAAGIDYLLVQFRGYWFLEDLLYISILYYFANCLLLKIKFIKEKYVDYILFGGSVLISAVALAFEHFYGSGRPSINSAAVCLAFFSFGHVFKKIETKVQLKPNRILYLIVGVILLVNTAFLSQKVVHISVAYNQYGNPLVFVPCAIMGSLGVLYASKAINKSKVLGYYGKNSLIMITTQFPIIEFGRLILEHINNAGIKITGIMGAVCLCVFAVLIEVLVISIVNKFFPIFAGKPKFEIK